MKKLLIIGGSPRPNGVSEELIRQVKPYFIDCKIVEYNTYKLAPAPCTDCRFCEQHAGCAESSDRPVSAVLQRPLQTGRQAAYC